MFPVQLEKAYLLLHIQIFRLTTDSMNQYFDIFEKSPKVLGNKSKVIVNKMWNFYFINNATLSKLKTKKNCPLFANNTQIANFFMNSIYFSHGSTRRRFHAIQYFFSFSTIFLTFSPSFSEIFFLGHDFYCQFLIRTSH